jgi:hypothetical protein
MYVSGGLMSREERPPPRQGRVKRSSGRLGRSPGDRVLKGPTRAGVPGIGVLLS